MKIFKKVSALVLILSMMLALAPPAQASSGLNSEAQRIIQAIEDTEIFEGFREIFVNRTTIIFLRFDVQPTAAEADRVIGYVNQAAALAAQVDNEMTHAEHVVILGQIKGLIERAANIFCLTTIVEYSYSRNRFWADAFPHPHLCQDRCCPTTGGGDDCPINVSPGTPGTGGGAGGGTAGGGVGGATGGGAGVGGDTTSPIRQTGLNASTGLFALVALTGVAGGTGLLAKKKD